MLNIPSLLFFVAKIIIVPGDPSVHTLKGGERDVTNNLFALLGAVVSLVPGLVERTGLAGTLGDLVLLEVFAANA